MERVEYVNHSLRHSSDPVLQLLCVEDLLAADELRRHDNRTNERDRCFEFLGPRPVLTRKNSLDLRDYRANRSQVIGNRRDDVRRLAATATQQRPDDRTNT